MQRHLSLITGLLWATMLVTGPARAVDTADVEDITMQVLDATDDVPDSIGREIVLPPAAQDHTQGAEPKRGQARADDVRNGRDRRGPPVDRGPGNGPKRSPEVTAPGLERAAEAQAQGQQQAQEARDRANERADQANAVRDQANDHAQQAQSRADEARSDAADRAGAAQSNADEARQQADEAQSRADEARADAADQAGAAQSNADEARQQRR